MSRASRAALRRTPRGHPLGVMADSGDTAEGVIDPDMVALFDDFLGKEPISVVPNRHLERRRSPLIVGIRGGTRALSCGTGPEPRLSLEDVGLLDLFSGDKDRALPFTFYKTFGGSTHTFEAAAFPGLFLSTAREEPLGLAPGATAFYLRRK
ncbi:interleukin-36 receptor antagonist protein-like [Ammospiza maritima maritima]